MDLVLLFFGQVVEVVGQPALDLLAAVLLWVLEDLLPLFAHTLEAATQGVNAGGEAPLQHCHDEAEGARLRRVACGGLHRLVLDVAREGVVEVVLLAVEVELGRAYVAVGEERVDVALPRRGR